MRSWSDHAAAHFAPFVLFFASFFVAIGCADTAIDSEADPANSSVAAHSAAAAADKGLIGIAGLASPLAAGERRLAAPLAAADDGRAAPPLTTPWTAEVSPDNALPEYPRPQMVRSDWQNPNGQWQFARAAAGETPPFGRDLAERVLVPYPIESALSGIQRHEDRMWYRRTFTVPEGWSGRRVQLNFDAVDWQTTVYVNGARIGSHDGGYDGFSFDITDHLRTSTSNELIVGVYDPSDGGGQPIWDNPDLFDVDIFWNVSNPWAS